MFHHITKIYKIRSFRILIFHFNLIKNYLVNKWYTFVWVGLNLAPVLTWVSYWSRCSKSRLCGIGFGRPENKHKIIYCLINWVTIMCYDFFSMQRRNFSWYYYRVAFYEIVKLADKSTIWNSYYSKHITCIACLWWLTDIAWNVSGMLG